MTISVAQQAAALAQAAALGLAVGLLYDLFRVLRVRVALPLLGAVLDLSFWIIVTVALFVWSQQAWRGEIRLYGIFFLFGGGVLYFWLISTWMLKRLFFGRCGGPGVAASLPSPWRRRENCRKN